MQIPAITQAWKLEHLLNISHLLNQAHTGCQESPGSWETERMCVCSASLQAKNVVSSSHHLQETQHSTHSDIHPEPKLVAGHEDDYDLPEPQK